MSDPQRKRALLIGNENYRDETYNALPSTRADTSQLRQVLEHPSIGGFDVKVCMDLTASDMRYEIDKFLDNATPEDLVLLYISGHGIRMRQSTGEFFFIAADTRSSNIEETAVSAGFVNDQLEACRAPQKITILDACYSGGFAVGFATRSAKSQNVSPLTSRGVYVISSSTAGEESFGSGVTADGPLPSAFTAEIVEALRTGKGDLDGDGMISIDELFDYVNRRLRARDVHIRQTPVKSVLAATGTIKVAHCYVGPAIELRMPQGPRVNHPVVLSPNSVGYRETKDEATSWPELLKYFRACVLAENFSAPLFTEKDEGSSFICLTGSERLLSTDLDDTKSIQLPGEAQELAAKASREDAELWCGYPIVVLSRGKDSKHWRVPRFAPLLVRRVELVQNESGQRLEPYGPVLPHPRLASAILRDDEVTELLRSYRPTWHAGEYNRLVADIRHLLSTSFGLDCVQELRPEALADTIDLKTPVDGARNVAVLYRAQRESNTTKNLIKDIDYISDNSLTISSTALDCILAGTNDSRNEAVNWQLVTPSLLNEPQEAVIQSAMTTRLTVATGPPGTGKSQLVTNLVATAIANGQRVLVASTNNQAVDEVWLRCQELAPGALIRTGSSTTRMDYRRIEMETLYKLVKSEGPRSTPFTTKAKLLEASKRVIALRQHGAAIAVLEKELWHLGGYRERLAVQLNTTPTKMVTLLERRDNDLERWEVRLRRAIQARLFSKWRRKRTIRRLDWNLEATHETCRLIHEYIRTEQNWRQLRIKIDQLNNDQALSAALDEQAATGRTASQRHLQTVVDNKAQEGKQTILSLIQASSSQKNDWPILRKALNYAQGWAVTSLTARRFPPDPGLFDLVVVDEASQCSIPHLLPLLFRAKRALVIGDPMQLPHISLLNPQQEAIIRQSSGISSAWLEDRQLAYRRHSAFHACQHVANGSLLLDEHYRCHPAIAAVANRIFYGNQLTVLTNTTGRPRVDRPPITWSHVAGRVTRSALGVSWRNDAEVERVQQCVDYLLEHLPNDGSIGVVTPFASQSELLSASLANRGPRVRVGTVHTFQGGERDAIVFSLVATNGISPGSLSWLERQVHLWNVAITRARTHLVLVGDRDFWRHRAGIAGTLLDAVDANTHESHAAFDNDELVMRLYHLLAAIPGADVELGVLLGGYAADASVKLDSGDAVVLLDRGHGLGDPMRHLRILYEKQRLISNVGGKTIRLPAWRLFDEHTDILALIKN